MDETNAGFSHFLLEPVLARISRREFERTASRSCFMDFDRLYVDFGTSYVVEPSVDAAKRVGRHFYTYIGAHVE